MLRRVSEPYLTSQRIEAFSDGVFAIAITLLVLEFKVPQPPPVPADETGAALLATNLLHQWPAYFGYIFTFVIIGIYWANHHYLFHLYKKSDHFFALINVFFLMCISFLPYPTAVLTQYITDPMNRQAAITFYLIGQFLPALGWLLVWLYGSGRGLIDPRLDPVFVRYLTRQYCLRILLYAIAVLVSTINGNAGLGLCIALALLYLMPPKSPVYLTERVASGTTGD